MIQVHSISSTPNNTKYTYSQIKCMKLSFPVAQTIQQKNNLFTGLLTFVCLADTSYDCREKNPVSYKKRKNNETIREKNKTKTKKNITARTNTNINTEINTVRTE